VGNTVIEDFIFTPHWSRGAATVTRATWLHTAARPTSLCAFTADAIGPNIRLGDSAPCLRPG